MVLLSLLSFLILIWCVWTKMAESHPTKQIRSEMEQRSPEPQAASENKGQPSKASTCEPQESSVTQLPSAGTTLGLEEIVMEAHKQPAERPLQDKPPSVPSPPDSPGPAVPATSSTRPLSHGSLPSLNKQLKPARSFSRDEQEQLMEPRQAKLNRQAMAKFVLGSFEDNSSDDEVVSGSFKVTSRRGSMVSGASSSSFESFSVTSLLESGSFSTVMR